jgi:hypothetical protein
MNKAEYKFKDRIEFDNNIKKIDISVPLRSKGRKTEHTERYSLVSFLQNFIGDKYFNFPIKIIHRDRPDFLIETSKNNTGIEFTESIPEQLARAQTILEEHFPDGHLEPSFFKWYSPERTNSEILEILKKSQVKLTGQGYTGNQIEEEWSKGIVDCIRNKTVKLNKNGFDQFDKNWLLIYDNQTRAFLDKEYISNRISALLLNYWKDNQDIKFEKIFIESGNCFYVIDSNSFHIKKIFFEF